MQALDVTLCDITNPQEDSHFANRLSFLGRQMHYNEVNRRGQFLVLIIPKAIIPLS